ncbi:MAG: ribonuclease D [Rhodospirillaceae bacterium]|nr:ribonuclease D [Rhodospirillaceae bacterium]MBT5658690.1 ribonuclease D [Rhodospirillaceae bacterium]MBT5753006.1 ribonuclease D [Rhodospirillaceae bacterium]
MTLIADNAALAAACERFSKEPYIAVDTEFLRDKTYYARLCVVQIGGINESVAIDALAPGLDLAPLYELMTNEHVLKVFHAGRQDIEIFFQMAEAIPHPIFDTQVAAMVCGFGDSVGFETLAMKLANAQVDKSMRFTDWSRRPLQDSQIDYALADVIHLRPIYESLLKTLSDNGRVKWLEEEMTILTNPDTYRMEPQNAWKRLKSRNIKPRFLAILREVAAWRETEAKRRDVPRNRIIRDDALMELAATAPSSPKDLAHSRSFPKNQAESAMGKAALDAVARGAALAVKDCPNPEQKPDLPSNLKPVVELLKVLLKAKCENEGVAQKLVANGSELEMIALDDEADVPALHGWRRAMFGEDALALKHGKLALSAGKGAVKVIPVD